jgi:hypothetical protein
MNKRSGVVSPYCRIIPFSLVFPGKGDEKKAADD